MSNEETVKKEEPKLYNKFEKLDKELLEVIDRYSQSDRKMVLKLLDVTRASNIILFFTSYYLSNIWTPDISSDIDVKDFIYELHNIINKYEAYNDIIEKNIDTQKFAISLDIATGGRSGTLNLNKEPTIKEEEIINPVYSIIIYLKGLMYLYAKEQSILEVLANMNPTNN